MIDNKKLVEIIEKYILEGGLLTTRNLNELNLNSKKIAELIKKGILERVKKGYYKLANTEILFDCGQNLFQQNNYKKAILFFQEFVKISNNIDAYLMLFLCYIKQKDYENTFTIYDSLVDLKYNSFATNLYLFLLNLITEIPEKYQEFVKSLTIEDCKSVESNKEQDKILNNIFSRRIQTAIRGLKHLLSQSNPSSIDNTILSALLKQSDNAETENRNKILCLTKNREYAKIVKHLTDRQEKIALNGVEIIILELASKALELEETRIIPDISDLNSTTVISAIKANNFEVALRLNKEYNASHNINSNKSTISILLNQIVELINAINKEQEGKNIESTLESKEEVTYNNQDEINTNSAFTKIISSLLQQDLNSTFVYLKKYLEIINKSEYEFIIANLIKISLSEKDTSFTKPIIALTLIGNGNYTFDISTFIQGFYLSLFQNNFETARIYLDILKGASKLNQKCILLENLQQILDMVEQKFKESSTAIPEVHQEQDTAIEAQTDFIPTQVVSNSQSVPVVSEEKLPTIANATANNEIKNIPNNDNAETFIANKYNELCSKKGVILLNPMPKERRARIHKIVEGYSNMVSFSIGEEPNRQIVLRYFEFEKVDISSYLNTANEAYIKKNYNDCIANYLYLLQALKKPKIFIYAKLGLAYLKSGHKNSAIKYLTIATSLSKRSADKRDQSFDFSGIIRELKGKVEPDEEIKPYFIMTQNDFDYSDANSYYGINNFDEITTYIVETGLSVEAACQSLNMCDWEIDTIKLIYAREFYIQGDFAQGDLFLKDVEKNKNKSQRVTRLIKEIRSNKKFYKNRREDTSRILSLNIKPN